jgi:subfamily B ATP-binding cassette protein MsbA
MKNIFGILPYVKGYWKYAIWNIVFNVLSVLFSVFSIALLFPFLQVLFSNDNSKLTELIAKGKPAFHFSTNAILDNINYALAQNTLDHGKGHVLSLICIFIITTFVFKNLFRYLAMYSLAPIRNGVVKDIRNKIFKKTLELPLSYYSEERKGDIISRMTTDVQEIEWNIMQSLEMIFREPINIVIFLVLMVAMSAKLTLIAFILLPITVLLIGKLGRSLRRSSSESKERMGTLLSMMDETLGGLRIIKGFNAERKVAEKFETENESFTKLGIKVGRKVDLASPLSETLGVSVLVVLLFITSPIQKILIMLIISIPETSVLLLVQAHCLQLEI